MDRGGAGRSLDTGSGVGTVAPMLATLTVLAASAVPQEPDLDPLRAAFRGMAGDAPRVAIAVLPGGAPTILGAGRDARGADADGQSLLPLGGACRLLVADALEHGLRVDRDRVVAEAGSAALTVGELLAGTVWLPDWFAWQAVERAPDRAALLQCAAIAAAAKRAFHTGCCGMAEVVLLEPLLLEPLLRGGRAPDLGTALRVHLAPHVPGLDPRDARALGAELGRVLQPAAGAAAGISLAAAEPAALRLVLTAKEIASWWQWRLQRELPPATGPRTGRVEDVAGHAGRRRWQFHARGPAVVRIVVYADAGEEREGLAAARGALLVFDEGSASTDPLCKAFEQCLFGPPQAVEEIARFGGRAVIADPFAPLRDTSWVLRDGGEELGIEVRGTGRSGLRLRTGERVLHSRLAWRTRDAGWDVELGTDADGAEHRLVLHHRAGPAPELHAVWQRSRTDAFAVPRPLVFVPEQ